MPSEEPYQGVVARTLEDSVPWWPPLPQPREGTPNVVMEHSRTTVAMAVPMPQQLPASKEVRQLPHAG